MDAYDCPGNADRYPHPDQDMDLGSALCYIHAYANGHHYEVSESGRHFYAHANCCPCHGDAGSGADSSGDGPAEL